LGDLDGAEACYERALALNPKSADTLSNHADLLRMRGRLCAAKTSATRESKTVRFHCGDGDGGRKFARKKMDVGKACKDNLRPGVSAVFSPH
jgi:Tfp pilus assembly protein PilF